MINKSDQVMRKFRYGQAALCTQEIGALIREIERLRFIVADYEAVFGGGAVTRRSI